MAMLVYQRVMSSINQPTNGKSTSMVKDYNRGLLISFPSKSDSRYDKLQDNTNLAE